MLARAENNSHEVVYDWSRGRFENYEADEVSEVSEASTASEAAQVCEVTELSDSESHVSPVPDGRHWDSCPHPDTSHSAPIRRLHQGKHCPYATETHIKLNIENVALNRDSVSEQHRSKVCPNVSET